MRTRRTFRWLPLLSLVLLLPAVGGQAAGDPALVVAYREHARKYSNPPHRADLLKPTQELLTSLVSIAGEQAVGISTLDPAAFLFPTPAK